MSFWSRQNLEIRHNFSYTYLLETKTLDASKEAIIPVHCKLTSIAHVFPPLFRNIWNNKLNFNNVKRVNTVLFLFPVCTSQYFSINKFKWSRRRRDKSVGAKTLFKMEAMQWLQSALLICFLQLSLVESQVLTPPYFNLATGRRIMASATCGEDISDESELYCKLAGANADADVSINLIQGQVMRNHL